MLYIFLCPRQGTEESYKAHVFWAVLKIYWSPTKIEAWQKQVTVSALTKHCANLICLSSLAHHLWGKARFALKPFQPSEDKRKKIQAQFFLDADTSIFQICSVDYATIYPL